MDDNQWLNDFLEDSIPKWKADPVMFMREVLRICFRELAYKGEIPGVRKASW